MNFSDTLDELLTPDYIEIHGQHSDDRGGLVEVWRFHAPDFSEVLFSVEQRDIEIVIL